MKVKVTCEQCGAKVHEEAGMDVLLPVGCKPHVCSPTLKDCRAQFGASDVEHLARAIYHAFHNMCPCSCHRDSDDAGDWDMYARDRGLSDDVIKRFRQCAVDVALVFSDGYIGGVYYDV